eukprot:754357-Hanusia_phi.AAC.4
MRTVAHSSTSYQGFYETHQRDLSTCREYSQQHLQANMPTCREQLAKVTKIVADTGDLDRLLWLCGPYVSLLPDARSIRSLQPEDATTNPSLILAAVKWRDAAGTERQGSDVGGEGLYKRAGSYASSCADCSGGFGRHGQAGCSLRYRDHQDRAGICEH